MLKKLLTASGVIALLGSCTSFRPVAFNNPPKQVTVQPAPDNSPKETRDVKFLDNISSGSETNSAPATQTSEPKKEYKSSGLQSVKRETPVTYSVASATETGKTFSPVQAKYSELLNTDASQIQNVALYENIDEWWGTPYRMGGSTKNGIDCSAFVQTVFTSAYGVSLPRTAREQYKYVKLISTTELKEGDLLFFNTRGFVSHVGIYLQNNKFVHASSSGGVHISDMFEPYYLTHLICAGRVEGAAPEFHPENVYKSPYHKKSKYSSKKHSSKTHGSKKTSSRKFSVKRHSTAKKKK